MSAHLTAASLLPSGDFCIPGTCCTAHVHVGPARGAGRTSRRDPAARQRYLSAALAGIPRLLGAIDRNPFRPTYGCLDRQFWHYRTASFPSEMYQEGVLPLALIWATDLPGNRWFGNARVRELAAAGIRFAARSSHPDGSCDDYYPFERALGAAVFSLQAAARAYRLLELSDPDLVAWFERRADWIVGHDEAGHLANHHALAALGLLRTAEITGQDRFRRAAAQRVRTLLDWQSGEGWFEEYGGADPGYQTVTIDCLAKYRRKTGTAWLDEPLQRAVAFARLFLHPDHSFGGEYGSRGTYHFYPHGMELLAPENGDAADLAEGFLASLSHQTEAHFDDDRMFTHRLGNLIEAYLDWSPDRPASGSQALDTRPGCRFLPHARMLVRRTGSTHTVISGARGGVFKHFVRQRPPVTDAGLIVETADDRVAVSQWHDPGRRVDFAEEGPHRAGQSLTVAGPLHWTRFETATPLKQSLLNTGMWTAGRWCRTLVRSLLQRRLITGRRECPVKLTRRFELPTTGPDGPAGMRVTDTIELTAPGVRVRRMAFGTDHEVAYVAASGVYQASVLAPWTDLAGHVDRLNADRRVVIVREF